MNMPRARTGPPSRRPRVKLRLVDLHESPAAETGAADNWLVFTLLVSAFVVLVTFVMRFV